MKVASCSIRKTKNAPMKIVSYPLRKASASFKNAELISIGNGNLVNKLGKRTIASHCSPTL